MRAGSSVKLTSWARYRMLISYSSKIEIRLPMSSNADIRQVQLVGKKIRQLRKDSKLTQTELSSRIGIQQPDLSRMEKGHYRVSLDTLFKILAEFDMGIGEFFDELNRESFTARDVRLVSDFKDLERGAQKEVEGFIRFKKAESESSDEPVTERAQQ